MASQSIMIIDESSSISRPKETTISFITGVPQYKRQSLFELQQMARTVNGYLLDNNYKTINDYYKWQCSNGHIFKMRAHNVKYLGSWCPICLKRQIDQIKNIPFALREYRQRTKRSILNYSRAIIKKKNRRLNFSGKSLVY